MKIRITGSNGQIYTLAVQDIIKSYLKTIFWLSWLIPFGAKEVYDLIEPYIK